ncbi:hypothetical protein LPJ61_003973 [Coemansia biformis]|uniref:Uncharacterized protein n=1 Tax=Coemansia biformis TaxID=1286918 RepID=A0A9W7YBJ9_9FUNG|nr:hypothetical protein LPJ61_003973 [Coemansia biformis]
MANIAATFTSGLLVGSGSACAFAAYMTGNARLVDLRLRWAAAELSSAVPGEDQSPSPTWPSTKSSVLSAYQRLAARLSDHAAPLAKSEWNGAVRSAAHGLTQTNLGTDRLVAAFFPA